MVKEGYKQTELGVIPEDWEVRKLADVLKIRHGKSQKEIVDSNGIYPILGTGGEIGKTNIPIYTEPSVLIGRKGTIDLPRYMDTPFWTVDTLFYTEIFKNTDAKFVFYKFNLIDWYSYNEASGVPSLNAATIENIEQAFPILKEEQRSLAQALSDVDDLIAALDKLIAKKRDLKTATMQQLLTGKKRLPGFGEGQGYKESAIGLIPEDWDALRLGDVAPLQRGFDLPTSQLRRGHYPVVYSNGIINHHSDFMVKAPGVVTGRSGTIGNVHYVSENYWPHNTALWVTEFKCNNPKYIYYLYKSVKLERFGSGSGVPTLNRNDVHDWIVSIPKAEEQRAIATVLSDMDKAIAAIESRLTKTQAIKRGMMQDLLTGRIRLKIKE